MAIFEATAQTEPRQRRKQRSKIEQITDQLSAEYGKLEKKRDGFREEANATEAQMKIIFDAITALNKVKG